eukprot:364686-Chlamydomonas_euryale.AAC.10
MGYVCMYVGGVCRVWKKLLSQRHTNLASLRSTALRSDPLKLAPRRRANMWFQGVLVDSTQLAVRRSNSDIMSQNKRQPRQTKIMSSRSFRKQHGQYRLHLARHPCGIGYT